MFALALVQVTELLTAFRRESLFGAPPPVNPARDTNPRNRWKSHYSVHMRI
jgi:hypothetical protein